MSNIVLLDSQSHRKLRVHARPAAQYGDNQRFVAVVVNEFPALAMHYPILFSKDADTGQFYCGAMLGFDAGENLFLDEHRTFSLYRPLNLQRGPFLTSGSDLAIDLDHPRVAPSGDQELFTEAGEPSSYLQSIIGLMRDLRPGLERSRIFIDTLLGLKLIEPMTISARFDDGTNHEFTGLYTVNRDQLKELADAAALDLFRRGYLQLIYLMLASRGHVSMLAQRKNRSFLPGGDSRGGLPPDDAPRGSGLA
jgi:SapC